MMGCAAPAARTVETSWFIPTTVKVAPLSGDVSFSIGAWHPPFAQQLQLSWNEPREYGSLNRSNVTEGSDE